MALKTFKPITPSLRYKTVTDFSSLTPQKELPKRPRKLTQSKSSSGGRNVYGRTTTFHKGGGHKRRYRMIDFKRLNLDIPGKVASLEYDPNRSTFIALINFANGDKRFILAPQNLKVGDEVIASEKADIQPGNHLSLGAMPSGTILHNLELEPGRGGTVARSAGQFAQLMAKDGEYCQVRLPSNEIRRVHRTCRATVGQLSNQDYENVSWGKAGRIRWLGIRPTTRGVAMNPVDHPMGGGEGRASGGHPRSPWGQKAKGLKTRKAKRSNTFIVRRRNSKKSS